MKTLTTKDEGDILIKFNEQYKVNPVYHALCLALTYYLSVNHNDIHRDNIINFNKLIDYVKVRQGYPHCGFWKIHVIKNKNINTFRKTILDRYVQHYIKTGKFSCSEKVLKIKPMLNK